MLCCHSLHIQSNPGSKGCVGQLNRIIIWINGAKFNEIKVKGTIIYHSIVYLHRFKKFNQHEKQKLPFRAISLSSRPFRNDLIARCSEAYVMKDANIMPPTTIKPNLLEI